MERYEVKRELEGAAHSLRHARCHLESIDIDETIRLVKAIDVILDEIDVIYDR